MPESREIGSEFHWDPGLLGGVEHNLPGRLFATGCGAMTALLRRLNRPGRLHVPSFFCMGVAEALSALMPVAWYHHRPDGHGPRLATLEARPGDIVLAQNLFGRETGEVWRDWITAHPDITVIEDHSHDPFGPWATTSISPYAVASLRKTLPVPDGGLLWSPQGLDVPVPFGPPAEGSHLKLAAMVLKAAWLNGSPVPKDAFRAQQQQGEHILLGSEAPPSAFTAAVLPALDIDAIRTASTRNARALEVLLDAADHPRATLLAPPGAWARGAAPFRVQLLCTDEPARNDLLRHLAGHGVYAPVHWRQGSFRSDDDEAAALAARVLTVPVDHRCEPVDVHRVAAVLTAGRVVVS
ncbi:hypothetical protein JIG36_48165 [Actinoplanes sp. LDG1-06]|uniref:DegT/DnrJ/EryC1/StrS aminotransferase family protein n=1 Tax=Paractinoplanes ovalisporus TaxID=2810368 RepID=A0ABS2ATX5_9ACTN|nr:hypothetical protein [Actinoplanes ovalisporus]